MRHAHTIHKTTTEGTGRTTHTHNARNVRWSLERRCTRPTRNPHACVCVAHSIYPSLSLRDGTYDPARLHEWLAIFYFAWESRQMRTSWVGAQLSFIRETPVHVSLRLCPPYTTYPRQLSLPLSLLWGYTLCRIIRRAFSLSVCPRYRVRPYLSLRLRVFLSLYIHSIRAYIARPDSCVYQLADRTHYGFFFSRSRVQWRSRPISRDWRRRRNHSLRRRIVHSFSFRAACRNDRLLRKNKLYAVFSRGFVPLLDARAVFFLPSPCPALTLYI